MVLQGLTERERQWILGMVASDQPTVPLHASTIVRAVIRLLPPLPVPTIEIGGAHQVAQIAPPPATAESVSGTHGQPMRRVGEGIYFLDGVTVVTSDAFSNSPTREDKG